eukprot:scaffold955_cov250-Pinguiococcus_pyrenoidosus.AAC.1
MSARISGSPPDVRQITLDGGKAALASPTASDAGGSQRSSSIILDVNPPLPPGAPPESAGSPLQMPSSPVGSYDGTVNGIMFPMRRASSTSALDGDPSRSISPPPLPPSGAPRYPLPPRSRATSPETPSRSREPDEDDAEQRGSVQLWRSTSESPSTGIGSSARMRRTFTANMAARGLGYGSSLRDLDAKMRVARLSRGRSMGVPDRTRVNSAPPTRDGTDSRASS